MVFNRDRNNWILQKEGGGKVFSLVLHKAIYLVCHKVGEAICFVGPTFAGGRDKLSGHTELLFRSHCSISSVDKS